MGTGAHWSTQPESGNGRRQVVRDSRTPGVLCGHCRAARVRARSHLPTQTSWVSGNHRDRPRSAQEAPKSPPRPHPASSRVLRSPPGAGTLQQVSRTQQSGARSAPVSPPWATARAAATSSGSTTTSRTRSGARRCSVSACDHNWGPGGRNGMGGQRESCLVRRAVGSSAATSRHLLCADSLA